MLSTGQPVICKLMKIRMLHCKNDVELVKYFEILEESLGSCDALIFGPQTTPTAVTAFQCCQEVTETEQVQSMHVSMEGSVRDTGSLLSAWPPAA